MTREKLPNRRRRTSEVLCINGWSVMFGAGCAADGRILELFIQIPAPVPGQKNIKSGSDIEGLQQDCAVLISRLLQHGETVEQIRRGLGRQSDGAPASIAGAALDWLSGLEGEAGKDAA